MIIRNPVANIILRTLLSENFIPEIFEEFFGNLFLSKYLHQIKGKIEGNLAQFILENIKKSNYQNTVKPPK